ncbi:MAG: DUF255 domain-containing protein [Fimbriimonadaceae bacterium]|nr:DUF255 domain-containing protein [Fimbriimonadaceae bacterium]
MPNRLADSPSPYLRQHAANPVDWYPWGDEALDRARAENKPIFLSIGYSSCHWCHVMAHESFEDGEVGETLNRDFISIKLDREERPDIDEIYMTATQLATGHGGWPLTIFLTPDQKPFFVGTYFPRQARGDFPGFLTIVSSLARAWKEQESEIREKAEEFAQAIDQVRERTLSPQRANLDWEICDRAIQSLHDQFDREHGGYGDRPKFPPHATLEFLLKYASARPQAPGDPALIEDLSREASFQALLTLERMALGGIHDHVGGGFHRYSTDGEWFLPHFEKMLTDNAQLLVAYATAASMAGDERLRELYDRASKGIVGWVWREMTAADGTFYTALDADSEGEEGAFYVWKSESLADALTSDFGAFAMDFGVRDEGNFADEASGAVTGSNVLSLSNDVGARWEGALQVLQRKREGRPRPGLDDKRISGANGLMIGALAFAGETELSEAAATVWHSIWKEKGFLPRYLHIRGASNEGFLDDYVYMAQGLTRLAKVSGNEHWQEFAAELMEYIEEEFLDEVIGDYTMTSKNAPTVFAPTKPILDQAVPSPNGVAAIVWQSLGHPERASAILRANLGWVEQMPQSTETLLSGILGHIAVLGSDEGTAARRSAEVAVSLDRDDIGIHDDGYAHTAIRFDIPDGHHINSANPPAQWLVPTTVHIDNLLGEVGFPGSEDSQYTGELVVPVRFMKPPKTTEFELRVRFQVCSETECYAPQEARLSGIVRV